MKIEILYIPNCPTHALARKRLTEVLAGEKIEVGLDEVLISSAAMAHTLKFPGSPTIRIDGTDIECQSEHSMAFGLMCRLYTDEGGAPSHQRLRDAIRKARGSEV